MGNEFSSTAQNMLHIFSDVRRFFSGITAQFYRRTQREEQSPLVSGARCRVNHQIELSESRGPYERKRRQSGKNRQLSEGNGQITGQIVKCEEACSLNKPLDNGERDVPPPLPPKKNRRRMMRYGVSYKESEREELLKDLLRQEECFSNRCVSITDESCASNSSECEEYEAKQSITNCAKHTVKRFSLPNLHSGCLLAGTNKDSDNIDIIDSNPQTLNIPNKCFETISNSALRSGGTVVFGELSRHISISNISTEKPIVFNYLPENFEVPPISPTEELMIKHERKLSRSHSGGGLVEDSSSKVSLPYLCSFFQSKVSPPRVQRSMSGGWVSRFENAQHVIFSNPLSMTFTCGEMSEIGNCQKAKGYSGNEPHISHTSNENGIPENISGKEKSEDSRTTDHSKNEPNVAAKERNQIPKTEISRMIEEALKLSERNMM